MKTKEVKLFVMAAKWNHDKSWDIHIASALFESCDYRCVVLLSEIMVDVDVPNVDEKQLTLEEVKQLEQAITKEKNESYARVKSIEEKIQSLLCIEGNQ